jgi:exonuclease VII large subunit
MLRDLYLAPVMLACYDAESDAEAAAAEAAAAEVAAAEAAATAAAKGGEQVFRTQAQVNAYLAEDRRKTEAKFKAQQKAELQKQEKLYNDLLANKSLTEQERDSLRESLADVESKLHTEKERLLKEKKLLEEQFTGKLTETEKRAKEWENRFRESNINRQLQDAAVTGDAFNARLMVDLLRPKTELAEVKDAEGKPTGEYQVLVALDTVVDGKAVTLKLNPADAVNKMKEMPEQFGNLFKANVVSGMGANSGTGTRTSAGKVDVKNMSQTEYRRLRRDHPEVLGL